MTDECTIDLSRAPFLMETMRGPRPQTSDQAERIGHRNDIIRSLTHEIEQSADADFIERANWTIEKKRLEIYEILNGRGS